MTATSAGLDLHVCDSIEAALPEWSTFERDAASTLYQGSLWCQAWIETVGQAMAVKPRIVFARDASGVIRFMLPLQIRRRHGCRVLEWLGSPHHNYGYGLFQRDFLVHAHLWFEQNWNRIPEAIGQFDAIALTEMPDNLFGKPHPLAPAFNLEGANPSFALKLESDFSGLHNRKRSSEDRRTARKKESALSSHGDVSFGLPKGKTELHAMLDTMFEQQQGRLAERGVHGVFGPLERQFIHRLAELQDDTNPVLAPYHLKVGTDVLAVMLGGLHANGYWALISSLAQGPMRKYSPGDLALRRTIAACCEADLDFIDFSAGDSAYKRAWADDTIQLHTILAATNFAGLLWTAAMALRLTVKRTIKKSPVLLQVSSAARRLLFGRPSLKP